MIDNNDTAWRPTRTAMGVDEIGVNFFDNALGRMVFGAVSLSHYVELWDKKLLKFQREGKPKGDLPTQEQVLEYLGRQKEEKGVRGEPASYQLPPLVSTELRPIGNIRAAAVPVPLHASTLQMKNAVAGQAEVSRLSHTRFKKPMSMATLPTPGAPGRRMKTTNDEKKLAIRQASWELWAQSSKEKPLKMADIVRKACEILQNRVKQKSLETECYSLFSESQRDQLRFPQEEKQES